MGQVGIALNIIGLSPLRFVQAPEHVGLQHVQAILGHLVEEARPRIWKRARIVHGATQEQGPLPVDEEAPLVV